MNKTTNTTKTSSKGITFFGALGIVFITLKLLNKISWSWLWVLAPIWAPVATLVVVLAFCCLMAIYKK